MNEKVEVVVNDENQEIEPEILSEREDKDEQPYNDGMMTLKVEEPRDGPPEKLAQDRSRANSAESNNSALAKSINKVRL